MKIYFISVQKQSLEYWLKKIDATEYAKEKLRNKSFYYAFYLQGISVAVANILKQELLLCGGEFLIPQNAYYLKETHTNALLLASLDSLFKLSQKIAPQPPKIREIVAAIMKYTEKISASKYVVLKDGTKYVFDKPKIMGILNVTPDSFSDGGLYLEEPKMRNRLNQMKADGADIVDIGGESTRPGAEAVPVEQEVARVLPAIQLAKNYNNMLISLDTYKPEVAREGLQKGVDIINDIYALRYSPEMAEIVKEFNVPVVLMHMQGTPRNMQKNPKYKDVVLDILTFFEERIEYCLSRGISEDKIIIDPGIGFGKTFEHNLAILQNIEAFQTLGRPILLGASRKSFLGAILNEPEPRKRVFGTVALSVRLYDTIDIFRVHDVREHRQSFDIIETLAGRGKDL